MPVFDAYILMLPDFSLCLIFIILINSNAIIIKIINKTVPKKYAGCIPPVDMYSAVLFAVCSKVSILTLSLKYVNAVLIILKSFLLLYKPDMS